MMISPPSTPSDSSFTTSPLIATQSLPTPPATSPLSLSTVPSSGPSVAQPVNQSSTLTHLNDKESTSKVISHRLFRYLHTDPQLNAELTFYNEGLIWVLCYYRRDQQVGSSLYQSRATAELLLKSLGYRADELKEDSA